MLISEFLKNKQLEKIERSAIEDKENFPAHLQSTAKLLFGEDVPPSAFIFTNVKTFKENPLFANLELTNKGLHLFRYAYSTYAAKHRTRIIASFPHNNTTWYNRSV